MHAPVQTSADPARRHDGGHRRGRHPRHGRRLGRRRRLPGRLSDHEPVAGRLRRQRHSHQPRRPGQRVGPDLVVHRRSTGHPGVERHRHPVRCAGHAPRNVGYNVAHRHQRQRHVRLQRFVDRQQPGAEPASRSTAPPAPARARPHRRRADRHPADPRPSRPPHRRPPRRRPTTPPTPPAGVRADGGPRPGADQRPLRQRQPGLLAAARHRDLRGGVQPLPGLDQGQRQPDHRRHQLPRQRRGGRLGVHGAGRGRRRRAGGVGAGAAVRQRLPGRAVAGPGRGQHPERGGYTYSRQRRLASATSTATASYEIVLKWDPSNAKDNSQSGYTGNVYVDAYRLDRHPAVADRPGPQHPGRRPLHPVPGVRLRRRRPRRGGHEDRRRHPLRHRPAHRLVVGRLPQLQRLRPVRPGVPDHVQRPDRRRRCPR